MKESMHWPNDCMLLLNVNTKLDNFSMCGSSRWKNTLDKLNKKPTKVPTMILRYILLKNQLQRIFMCSETSVAMIWHATEQSKL